MIDAWIHELATEWGDRARRAVTEVAPLIARGELDDLYLIGQQLAAGGHALEDVLAWCADLATRSRSFRRLLERGGVNKLANGWADGALRQSFGITSIAPLEVLRLRVSEQATALSLGDERSAHPLALVVIEADGPSGSQTRLAFHARQTFSAGETLAATATGKLLILVRRNHGVRRRTFHLTEAMRLDESLRGTTVRVWIEPLATTAEHLDSHLLGLVS